jgi:hypothetical protein
MAPSKRAKPLSLIAFAQLVDRGHDPVAPVKRVVPTPYPTAPAAPRTAGQTVFELIHIRQHVMSYLRKSELAVFMRVDRETMHEVAAVLYKEVTYNRVVEGIYGSSVSMPTRVHRRALIGSSNETT